MRFSSNLNLIFVTTLTNLNYKFLSLKMGIKKCKIRFVKLLAVRNFLYWKFSLKEASELFSSNKDITFWCYFGSLFAIVLVQV